ncbi:PREDICTED: VIP peptides [Chrysochloris asiatica]|uniref:VIP peptides n=1 Tax=Chrysochloris asiatica TaxID=185453 RepID=A0A9B0U296_CHRAS|nr:PREDICTED: VIP peptides [Chrysochloris asiatica]
METTTKPQLLVFLTLCGILFSHTLAWPLFGALPSPSRLGDIISSEGESDPDQVSVKADTDLLQNVLAENDTPYYDVYRNTRHADGVFTSDYSRLLGQLSAKKYLESLIGKRVSNDISEDNAPIKRHSDAVFTNNYTRLRKQMAAKKYLNSILNGKRRLDFRFRHRCCSWRRLRPPVYTMSSGLPKALRSDSYVELSHFRDQHFWGDIEEQEKLLKKSCTLKVRKIEIKACPVHMIRKDFKRAQSLTSDYLKGLHEKDVKVKEDLLTICQSIEDIPSHKHTETPGNNGYEMATRLIGSRHLNKSQNNH